MAMFGRATANDQLRAYEPTMAERIPIALQGMFGKLGLDKYKARSFAKPIADALEWSPLGAAAAAIDAGVAARKSPTTTGMFGNLAGGAALAALGAVPGGKALRGAVNDARRGIVAYHGSPHTFDKFSLDKIGTGTGVSAFGHGLNFSKSERVATDYRDSLAARSAMVDGVKSRGGESDAHDVLLNHGWDVDAALEAAKDHLNHFTKVDRSYSRANAWSSILTDLQRWKDTGAVVPNKGSLYKVRINADEGDFIDWNKPLSEQSDKVRLAASRLVIPNDNPRVVRQLQDGTLSGSGLYHAPLQLGLQNAEPATKAWADQGIAGVSYLGDNARNGGVQAQNFSVFNDKLIDILKRYGWVPGTAVPTALMARAQSEAMGTPEAGGI